jgi:hypothetical protein
MMPGDFGFNIQVGGVLGDKVSVESNDDVDSLHAESMQKPQVSLK